MIRYFGSWDRTQRSTTSNELFQSNQMINYVLITIIRAKCLSGFFVAFICYAGNMWCVHEMQWNSKQQQQQHWINAKRYLSPLHISSNVMNEGFLWIRCFLSSTNCWCVERCIFCSCALVPFIGSEVFHECFAFFSLSLSIFLVFLRAWHSRDTKSQNALMYLCCCCCSCSHKQNEYL